MITTPTRTIPQVAPQVTPRPERYNPGEKHCPSQIVRQVRRIRRHATPS